ncbi:MAG: flagellar biosynthesis protein FlhB [Deltaproteobacteria bacterium]|nr:flagellar biosynthesis protein FlhB [Deltaproteobacteria bacterium]MBW1918605.1 flagellar biosynthesis protein FlhB [Deltaproteobacteria bacterium]MBW1934045.1 flagellar biosynthesis protein FlhB [Deltaproteobacteria bacterium]MBW1976383.1 flagellar biosynthesis protein FlhB [Deltaproteobacteria bacterium]MBW2043339.1 flagellar biosynthesis protein FlhB [Deltaproteobacteria bacterium]
MAEESFEEKTEQPTPKKREDAKKKGEVAKSRELSSVAVLLSGLITLSFFGHYIYTGIQTEMKRSFSLLPLQHFSLPDFMVFAQKTISFFILLIGPLVAAVFITAILSNVMQVGFVLSSELIKPKFSKINPVKGFGRLFSKQSLMELLKSLLKLAIVGGVAYLSVKGEMKQVPHMCEMEKVSIISYVLRAIFKLFIRCTLAMILLVIIDYAFQRWEFEKRLKMTKKEVKEEFKRTEGDPLVKSRIRTIQTQIARKRMMQAVPEADVVITNPTHLAVALKYDSSSMNAPKLLAKGAGAIARKIKEIAEKNHIPIVQNKGLAQSLYSLVQVDEEIPHNLYQIVAEVLAYVYSLKPRALHGETRSR